MIISSRRKWTTVRTCLASAIFVMAFFRQQRGLSNFLMPKDSPTRGTLLDPWSWLAMGNRLFSYDGFITAQNTTTIQEDSHYDLAPPRPVIIYSRLRTDQAGWVIYDMLKAHSYAFARNMTYGGACGESVHKQDVQDVLLSIGWMDILPLDCPTNDTLHRLYPSPLFERDHGNRMASTKWRDFIINHTDYSYFDYPRDNHTSKDYGRIQEDLAKKPFSIVVHIRRRDVTPCCYPHWYLPNSYFASMIEKYHREQIQNNMNASSSSSRPIQILIFSQSESHESWDDLFRKIPSHVNYTLHLDGPVGEVWRAIVSSDVFVGSISEFSRVPAMFARGQVPNPGNISDPIIASATKQEKQRLLEECGEIKIIQCKHKWWLKK